METSLYLHIPFCIAKCDYCDFFSLGQCSSVPDSYIQAMVRELNYYCSIHSISSWHTIYIGGGTPSLLSCSQFERLFDAIRSCVKVFSPVEITVELNPETVTRELLLTLEKLGVKRISLGIQSFRNNTLRKINRHCSRSDILRGLSYVKKYWYGEFNLDIIAGLPGENFFMFRNNLKKLLSYGSNHVSMYTLTLEESTPLYKKVESGKIKWNPDRADRLWLKGLKILKSRGFEQYEVSNFAKPGFYSRHNMVYWKSGSYIGVGSGASGALYEENAGVLSVCRYTNRNCVNKYIDFWLNFDESVKNPDFSAVREREVLTLEEAELEFLMMGFRTLRGVCAEDYKRRFSTLAPYYGNLEERLSCGKKNLWSVFIKENKARVYENKGKLYYSLTEKGLLFLNHFLMEI